MFAFGDYKKKPKKRHFFRDYSPKKDLLKNIL